MFDWMAIVFQTLIHNKAFESMKHKLIAITTQTLGQLLDIDWFSFHFQHKCLKIKVFVWMFIKKKIKLKIPKLSSQGTFLHRVNWNVCLIIRRKFHDPLTLLYCKEFRKQKPLCVLYTVDFSRKIIIWQCAFVYYFSKCTVHQTSSRTHISHV